MAYRVSLLRRSARIAAICGLLVLPFASRADELKLRDGTTLKGTIVGFDENGFKVQTSFGYAVVRKDEVVTIFVTGAGNPPSGDGPSAAESSKSAPSANPTPAATPTGDKTTPAKAVSAAPTESTKPSEKLGPPPPLPLSAVVTSSNVFLKDAVATGTPNADATAEPTKTPAATASVLTASIPALAPKLPPAKSPAPAGTSVVSASKVPARMPAAPKTVAPEPILETVSGNTYTNSTYHFQLYKPPGWQVLAAARTVLPGSIAALGTDDQGTYLLIGQEPAGKALYLAAEAADKRLRDVMENYRPQGQEQMLVAESWATAHRFRGSVDEHEWSGVVVLVPHGARLYTIFGMTRADTDLVQIQENVIDRAIASIQFSEP
jgi:hypothetical protein